MSLRVYRTITQGNLSSPFALDKLTNTHGINLKGQFFGLRSWVELVWCHHQLLFSTHAYHTSIPKEPFILLLYTFYLCVTLHKLNFGQTGVRRKVCLYINIVHLEVRFEFADISRDWPKLMCRIVNKLRDNRIDRF